MAKKDNKTPTTERFLNFVNNQNTEKEETKNNNNTSSKQDEQLNHANKAYKNIGRSINILNSFFDRLFASSLAIKLLSFALTMILVFVINGGSIDSILSIPSGGETITGVPVQVEGLDSQYIITGVPEDVAIMMVGSSLDITKVKFLKNYEVYLDASDLLEGEHTVEMKLRNIPDGLTVTIVPATTQVHVASKVKQNFPLSYRFIKPESLDDDLSVSIKSQQYDTVTVQGSQKMIDQIASVEADIDVSNVSESFMQEAPIYAYNKQGEQLDVEIEPSVGRFECIVSSFSKEVPIIPRVVGELKEGYHIKDIELDQNTVVIYGQEEALNTITEVTVDVDCNNLSDSLGINNLQLKQIDGINRMGIDQVDAVITVEKQESKTIGQIPVQTNGTIVDERTIDEQFVSVKFTGASSVIKALTVNDVQAIIDISRLESGKHTVDVLIVTKNKYISSEVIGGNKITIEI